MTKTEIETEIRRLKQQLAVVNSNERKAKVRAQIERKLRKMNLTQLNELLESLS